MTDDKQDRKDAYREGIDHCTTNIGASAANSGRIGSVETTSVYLDDDITWLAGRLSGETTLHAESVELDTNKGTFVFTADDDTVVVRMEESDD